MHQGRPTSYPSAAELLREQDELLDQIDATEAEIKKLRGVGATPERRADAEAS